jgi:hypothetical protein
MSHIVNKRIFYNDKRHFNTIEEAIIYYISQGFEPIEDSDGNISFYKYLDKSIKVTIKKAFEIGANK